MEKKPRYSPEEQKEILQKRGIVNRVPGYLNTIETREVLQERALREYGTFADYRPETLIKIFEASGFKEEIDQLGHRFNLYPIDAVFQVELWHDYKYIAYHENQELKTTYEIRKALHFANVHKNWGTQVMGRVDEFTDAFPITSVKGEEDGKDEKGRPKYTGRLFVQLSKRAIWAKYGKPVIDAAKKGRRDRKETENSHKWFLLRTAFIVKVPPLEQQNPYADGEKLSMAGQMRRALNYTGRDFSLVATYHDREYEVLAVNEVVEGFVKGKPKKHPEVLILVSGEEKWVAPKAVHIKKLSKKLAPTG